MRIVYIIAIETAAEASIPSKSQTQPETMVMQHLHLIIWKLENDWDRREKWIKKRDKLLDEQINLYQCVRQRQRQLYRWIAMNRDKGNDNLECGDWTIDRMNEQQPIACVQTDRRIKPLMRMTTFSPFQYQVQLELLIQLSDNIISSSSSYITTTSCSVVCRQFVNCNFIFICWLSLSAII